MMFGIVWIRCGQKNDKKSRISFLEDLLHFGCLKYNLRKTIFVDPTVLDYALSRYDSRCCNFCLKN